MILLFYPLDGMKLNVMYVCGNFVRHVFCKALLVFLSYLLNKTSGLVAHENSTCYDIKPVRKEEGKSYWKITLCDDDATREK